MSTEVASEASPTPVLGSRTSVIPGVILVAATLTTGLIAGLFYAYAVSVMPGLDRAGDRIIADLTGVRDDYYGPWVAWNIVRTVASTAALGCLGIALALLGRADAGGGRTR